jgi:hypothetical protein
MSACAACERRQPLFVGGAMHVLDLKLRGNVEIRKCRECGRNFFAVPLSEWADVVQDSDG